MREKPSKWSLAPTGDYDFEIGGPYRVGCFSDYDDDLLDNLAAAVVARFGVYSSMDYVRKRVLPDQRESVPDFDRPAKQAVAFVESALKQGFSSFSPREDSSLQTVSFDCALTRAVGTLQRSLYLARRGYVFETAMVARGCLEQIAWSRLAGKCKEENDLFKISGTRSIGFLKEIYPAAGQIYGELSKLSHFDANLHHLFYAEHEGKMATRFADRETKKLSMIWPFVISDIILTVFEEMYFEKLAMKHNLDENRKLISGRKVMIYFEEYFRD